MKKTNKFLLATGTIVAVAAPMVAVVSCGGSDTKGSRGVGVTDTQADRHTSSEARYNGKTDGKIRILSPWSANGPQSAALKYVVKKYNETNPAMPVEVVQEEGGYGDTQKQLSTWFEAEEKNKLPNMFIGYPDVLGVVSKYDMDANIVAEGAEEDEVRNLFNEAFLQSNDKIAGVESDSIYSLPIAKSVEMQSVDVPVMNYVLSQLGVTDIPSEWASKASADETKVATIWGAPSRQLTDEEKAKFTWANIGSDNKVLVEFAALAGTLFDSREDETYLFGIDSVANFFYTNTHSINQADFDKFLYKINNDGYINYTWNDEGSEAKAAFEEIYNTIKPALESGGLYLKEEGAFSSNLLKSHNIGTAIGSTAGYKYNYAGNGDTFTYHVGDNVLHSHTYHFDPSGKDQAAGIAGIYGDFDTKVYYSTATYDKEADSHAIQLPDAAADTAFDALVAAHQTDDLLMVSSDGSMAGIDGANKVQITSGEYPKYLALGTSVDIKRTTDTLQQSELEIKNVAWKFGQSGANSQLVQGPQLAAVHVTDEEDAEMQKFAKWLLTGGSLTVAGYDDDLDGTYDQPYKAFSSLSGYIVPTKDLFSSATAPDYLSSPAMNLTWEVLKQINDDASFYGFDNPVDDTTGAFRTQLESAIVSQFTAHKNGTNVSGPEEIYSIVERQGDFN